MKFQLVDPPVLDEGETLLASFGGSRQTVGSARIIGGRIFLTDRRLVQMPGHAERLARGRQWECSLRDITDIQVGGRFAGRVGGLGQTVVVALNSGDDLCFRVWQGRRFADQVLQAKNAAGTGSDPGGR